MKNNNFLPEVAKKAAFGAAIIFNIPRSNAPRFEYILM
jgi:hypothetical protein